MEVNIVVESVFSYLIFWYLPGFILSMLFLYIIIWMADQDFNIVKIIGSVLLSLVLASLGYFIILIAMVFVGALLICEGLVI